MPSLLTLTPHQQLQLPLLHPCTYLLGIPTHPSLCSLPLQSPLSPPQTLLPQPTYLHHHHPYSTLHFSFLDPFVPYPPPSPFYTLTPALRSTFPDPTHPSFLP
ncbi:hypothetical protein Pcinc_014279 [Petrolisthes cinctipes]|uniref:Uncharacterized protein n=1 Tax=Petrolisthes cinctipes TaxID=88211 RepID=A0AAE1KPD7_PETCI|nr:hypothetical protein Pcinc_014279 [Petrolisthes cinctipes]